MTDADCKRLRLIKNSSISQFVALKGLRMAKDQILGLWLPPLE